MDDNRGSWKSEEDSNPPRAVQKSDIMCLIIKLLHVQTSKTDLFISIVIPEVINYYPYYLW